MDIALFSEMVKSLILDNDEVTLPGVGSFVSEVVPSVFSDKGYTINPPYRKLSFRQRSGSDSNLARMYSDANCTDMQSSEKIIGSFLQELKETLETRKVVVLPGLGRLRATKENTFFFIPDEDLDIYPYGFGLEPVSLKTHEETDDEVSAAVAGLRSLIDSPSEKESTATASENPATGATPAPASSHETVPSAADPADSVHASAETVPATESEDGHPQKQSARPLKKVLVAVVVILVLVAVALGAFILLAHVAPDFIDSILYSPEELQIINHQ